MGIVVGIDIGGSTTKIVGLQEEQSFSPLQVKATDPVASVYGAFGKFMSVNGFEIGDIERVMVTGVGSSFIKKRIFGISTGKIDEFLAIGLGGQRLSHRENAIIVSMGTGTAYVRAKGDFVEHLGGTGVGGGTLLGLSDKMLNLRNFESIITLAQEGDLSKVDLFIGDISKASFKTLKEDSTASNFGKLSDLATKSDIALGIINLVFQTIGMIAIFAARNDENLDVVLTGNLTNIPQVYEIFDGLHKLFHTNFLIPEHAEFATALGAAIAYEKKKEYLDI